VSEFLEPWARGPIPRRRPRIALRPRLDGPARRNVWHHGRIVSRSTTQFELLRALVKPAGQPVKREDLSRSVLGCEYPVFDRAIDNLVGGLRIKSILNVG